CTLYLNGDHNASNAVVVNNTDTILTASTLNDALYVTTVNCTDGSSNKGNSSAITITVDATVPNVTASDALPSSTSFTNSSNVVEISINATDTLFLDDVLANITHPNGSIFLVALSNRTNYPNKFNVSFTVPRTANGNFNITFVVNDSNNNRNATIKTGFIINMTDTDGDGVPDPVDKLTGNITNVTTTGVSSLNVSIGGRPLNETLTGKKEVGFYDGSTVLVNFSHNFSISSLDLSKMTVISTATTLIINFSNEVNVTYNKTLFITDDSFATLCVKDQEISAAADISDACTGSNETSFTNCLGGTQTSGAITCTDFGTTIRFENLRYSGVKATQTASSSSVAEGSGGGGGGSAGAGGGRCAKGYSLVDGNCIHDETGEVQKARPEQVVEEEAQEEVVQEEQAEPGQEEQEVGAENLAGQASRFSFREFVNDYSKFWIVGVIVLVILIAGIFIYRWTKHWHSE
ncbi:TPA: hypothetical protein HA278_03225, partial [Candidatus Woesearchaeota archaeon]|nr:hypothetical protein [Candidatus Woesearchaeota archaeon]